MSIYDTTVKGIDGTEHAMREWRDHVLLVVNVASRCGFATQYEGLEALYRKYQGRGFVVLGFPCNQFGGQEPGDEAQIQQFCKLTYDVTFPMFAKVDVNGASAHPLWQQLARARPGLLGSTAIKWNFTKFLVDRQGNVVKRFAPSDKPADLEDAIASSL